MAARKPVVAVGGGLQQLSSTDTLDATVLPTTTVAEASGSTTTTSASDVLMSGMTLTPVAGTYAVWFSGDLSHSTNNATINTSLYVGGVLSAASERAWQRGTQAIQGSFDCACKVTVNGSQAIEGRWRTSGATATNNRRQLVIMRVQ